jgi:hypothetical protein
MTEDCGLFYYLLEISAGLSLLLMKTICVFIQSRAILSVQFELCNNFGQHFWILISKNQKNRFVAKKIENGI